VRFSRVGLAAVPMCHPSVIRSRQLMRHDVDNTLKSQDNHEWLRTLPLNPMECAKKGFERYPSGTMCQMRSRVLTVVYPLNLSPEEVLREFREKW